MQNFWKGCRMPQQAWTRRHIIQQVWLWDHKYWQWNLLPCYQCTLYNYNSLVSYSWLIVQNFAVTSYNICLKETMNCDHRHTGMIARGVLSTCSLNYINLYTWLTSYNVQFCRNKAQFSPTRVEISHEFKLCYHTKDLYLCTLCCSVEIVFIKPEIPLMTYR